MRETLHLTGIATLLCPFTGSLRSTPTPLLLCSSVPHLLRWGKTPRHGARQAPHHARRGAGQWQHGGLRHALRRGAREIARHHRWRARIRYASARRGHRLPNVLLPNLQLPTILLPPVHIPLPDILHPSGRRRGESCGGAVEARRASHRAAARRCDDGRCGSWRGGCGGCCSGYAAGGTRGAPRPAAAMHASMHALECVHRSRGCRGCRGCRRC